VTAVASGSGTLDRDSDLGSLTYLRCGGFVGVVTTFNRGARGKRREERCHEDAQARAVAAAKKAAATQSIVAQGLRLRRLFLSPPPLRGRSHALTSARSAVSAG